jgi:phosphatidylserine/phosphatidylglycerophosphate/cardiolipin synthase-like enzyme
MKLKVKLQGKFQRQLIQGEDQQPISLTDLLATVYATATEYNRFITPQLLKQSFGLGFIPESLFNSVYGEINLKNPRNFQLQEANIYHYQFINEFANLTLTPDDSQLPSWIDQESEITGNYMITLDSPDHPDLTTEFTEKIWQQSLNAWQNLPDLTKLEKLRNSLDVCLNDHVTLLMTRSDLPLFLREAMIYLQDQQLDLNLLSPQGQDLIQQYQRKYYLITFPQQLNLDPKIVSKQEIYFGKKQRQYLTDIVTQSENFLLLSSYIIEDESLTDLICDKADQLDQGVWILTDLRDEVIDRIDQQIESDNSLPENYQRGDNRKIQCLQKLLNTAKIKMRSGGFHLKTFISEKRVYLGSCNITPGSLDYNLEAGIIASNTPIHEQLIDLFRYFWENQTTDEVIAVNNSDSFRLQAIVNNQINFSKNYPNLLNPASYYYDLLQQLQGFRDQVIIFSRSFNPTSELSQLLSLTKLKIFLNPQVSSNSPLITPIRLGGLHAKITILGNKVAYIGGVNFNFSKRYLGFGDLMYKTTDQGEIAQIYQLIKSEIRFF